MLNHVGSDSDTDDGCYVFWESKSVLSPRPRTLKSASQRSDAPSPSLGSGPLHPPSLSAGTPKPKRTTSLASLPSPSASTTSTLRPLRQRKKRKALERRTLEASSQPLDERTLRMMTQLATKVNARAAGLVSPAVQYVETSRTPGTVEKGKGKMVEVGDRPTRLPLRPTSNSTSTDTTPLRRSQPNSPQTLLTRTTSSSKSSLTKSSTLTHTFKPPPPPVVPPALSRTATTSSTFVDDDDDSYFDGDDSFEFALSQLDELSTTTAATSPPLEVAPRKAAAVAPPSKPTPPIRAPPARLATLPSLRSSPRLARQNLSASTITSASTTSAIRNPILPPSLVASRSKPLPTSAVPSRQASLPPQQRAPPPRNAAPPAARPGFDPPRAVSVPPRAVVPAPQQQQQQKPLLRSATTTTVVISKKPTTAQAQQRQREIEALAKKECEELEESLGAGWSDDDEDF